MYVLRRFLEESQGIPTTATMMRKRLETLMRLKTKRVGSGSEDAAGHTKAWHMTQTEGPMTPGPSPGRRAGGRAGRLHLGPRGGRQETPQEGPWRQRDRGRAAAGRDHLAS